jgi:hypothetical protein
VLNNNIIYWGIIFTNRNESTTCIKCPYKSKLNEKTSWRLKPGSCQIYQHKTDRLTPDSHKTETPQDIPWHRSHSLLPDLPLSQLNFKLYLVAETAHSYSQAWRTLTIISGVHRSSQHTDRLFPQSQSQDLVISGDRILKYCINILGRFIKMYFKTAGSSYFCNGWNRTQDLLNMRPCPNHYTTVVVQTGNPKSLKSWSFTKANIQTQKLGIVQPLKRSKFGESPVGIHSRSRNLKFKIWQRRQVCYVMRRLTRFCEWENRTRCEL